DTARSCGRYSISSPTRAAPATSPPRGVRPCTKPSTQSTTSAATAMRAASGTADGTAGAAGAGAAGVVGAGMAAVSGDGAGAHGRVRDEPFQEYVLLQLPAQLAVPACVLDRGTEPGRRDIQ